MDNYYVDGLVSIVTPAYNSEKYIRETIDSVLAQSYTNWEMLIVNDCSTDNTLKIIKSYDDQRIVLIDLKKNGGTPNAWNQAFKVAKGEYIAFLDSDDVWEPEKLKEQVDFMRKNNFKFTCTAYDWVDENTKSLNKTVYVDEKKNLAQSLKNTNIGLLTVMLDRKEFKDLQVKNMKLVWDYYLWGKILQNGYFVYGYNKVLSHYRIVTNSASRNKKKHAKAVWNLYHKDLNIPFIKATYYFICYAINGIKKYYM